MLNQLNKFVCAGNTDVALEPILETDITEILNDELEEPLRKENLKLFLESKHCGEIFNFLQEVKKYNDLTEGKINKNNDVVVQIKDEEEVKKEIEELKQQGQDEWDQFFKVVNSIQETFIRPESDQEINISADLRKRIMQNIRAVMTKSQRVAISADSKPTEVFDSTLFKDVEGEVLAMLSMDHKKPFLRKATTEILSEDHKIFYGRVSAVLTTMSITTTGLLLVFVPGLVFLRLIIFPMLAFAMITFSAYKSGFCPVLSKGGVYDSFGDKDVGLIKMSMMNVRKSVKIETRDKEKLCNYTLEPRVQQVQNQMAMSLFARVFIVSLVINVGVLFLPPAGLGVTLGLF
eukprot:snap_masked-scaffold_22-processed-gene-3.13-mRNA-1 protein AED:1.00 eAED:1.00 QI:0/-1/0/0/-1/1/1/0/346